MTCTGPLARHASGSPAPRVPAAACCPAAPASPVGQARVIMKPALFSPPAAGPPGGGHAVVTGDIADPRQAADLVGAAVAALGGIDVLVNNAGVYAHQPIDG